MANLFELTSRLLEIKAAEANAPVEKKQKLKLTIDKDGQFIITRHGKTGLFSRAQQGSIDPLPPAA